MWTVRIEKEKEKEKPHGNVSLPHTEQAHRDWTEHDMRSTHTQTLSLYRPCSTRHLVHHVHDLQRLDQPLDATVDLARPPVHMWRRCYR
jgi:hypothetical protein